jgi:uncharacterized membrane protein YjjP (DUF1212 family)
MDEDKKTIRELLEAVQNGDMCAEDAEEAIEKLLENKAYRASSVVVGGVVSGASNGGHINIPSGGCHY